MPEPRPGPKIPTPVHDELGHEQAKRVANYMPQMLLEITAAKDEFIAARKGLVSGVTWGVFLGLWAFTVTLVMVFFGLSAVGMASSFG